MQPSPRSMRRLGSAAFTALVTVASGLVLAAPAQASNIVTPGNFTGYGFDQCLAPTQSVMDTWLRSSPYWAVGIYVSGASRGCPKQPNLTPTWVDKQLENGWRLLPITLGPQASCTTRDRYLHQVRINPNPADSFTKARGQGRAEAVKTVGVAEALGIGEGSTLWYDIEAFNISYNNCRESALSFLNAWTNKLHSLNYVSGIYSSAASGIKMLDDAQANRPGKYAMPDQVWIADWNGRADVYSSYVRSSSWMPHKRVHQYRGGHNETYGGVTINVDNNFLDLGTGSSMRTSPLHCGDVRIDLSDYHWLAEGTTRTGEVSALQCLLREKRLYDGKTHGNYTSATAAAVNAFRASHGFTSTGKVSLRLWTALLSQGRTPIVKYGSATPAVRRLQRALNAAVDSRLPISGVFNAATTTATKKYQAGLGLSRTGVVAPNTWAALLSGQR